MREILFRGKRASGNGWVDGCLINKDGNAFIIQNDSDYWHPVIPETVGQYTGFKDRDGVKIFEGDVCKLILNKVFVEFTSGSFKFRRVDKNDVFFPVCEFTVNQCHPEVIGNIHDNPELLENHSIKED